MIKFYAQILLLSGCIAMFCGASMAATYKKNENVEKPQENYTLKTDVMSASRLSPNQRNFGSFILFTALNVSELYNDNILAQETDERSDFITEVNPNIGIMKAFGRHSVGLDVSANMRRYAKYEDENTLDYRARFGGELEAYHNLKIPFSFSYTRDHRDRSNRQLSSVTKHPEEFSTLEAGGGFIFKPGRLQLELLGTYSQTRYRGVEPLIAGANAVTKSDDSNNFDAKAVLSYKGSTSWYPYIEALFSEQKFVNIDPANAPARDNQNIGARAGIGFDYHGLLTGRIGAGQEKRTYDSALYDSISALSVQGDLAWKPTRRLNIGASFGHNTREDSAANSGVKELSSSLSVGYELRPDLFLSGSTAYKWEDLINSTREDTGYEQTIGIEYFLKPRLSFGAGITHKGRDSNVSGFSYDENILMLRATGSL